jgi:hypothetical protein
MVDVSLIGGCVVLGLIAIWIALRGLQELEKEGQDGQDERRESRAFHDLGDLDRIAGLSR